MAARFRGFGSGHLSRHPLDCPALFA